MKLRFVAFLFAALSFAACGKGEDPVIPEPDIPDTPDGTIEVRLRSTGKSVSEVELDFSENSDVFLVTSNVAWTMEVSDAWIVAVRPETGIMVNFTVGVNLSGGDRTGKVLFRTEDGKASREVTVTQHGTDLIGRAGFSDMMLLMADPNDRICSGYLAADTDGKKEWLFDAFCLSLSRFDGVLIGSVNSEITKAEYEYAITEYLSSGKWLDRLDKTVSKLRSEIGGEYVPRKIIIAIPQSSSENWGEIDGVTLNTRENREDRVKAACWFVDTMLRDYAAACAKGKYPNLQLAGFYWQQENGDILPSWGSMIAGYLHERNLAFYWIPYFNAFNYAQWASYGFDMAWLQPNYMFDDNLDKSRLYNACDLAAARKMGMEVEWDNLRPLQKHMDYWDVYEERGILAGQPLTYYDNGAQIALVKDLASEDWKAFYRRVIRDIVSRQKIFYEEN